MSENPPPSSQKRRTPAQRREVQRDEPERLTAGQLKRWLEDSPDRARIWLYDDGSSLEGITAVDGRAAREITVWPR